jgi:GAF domain-containing protein
MGPIEGTDDLLRKIRNFEERSIEAEGLIIYCIEEMNLLLGWPLAHVFACLGEDLFSSGQRSFWRMHSRGGAKRGHIDCLKALWPGTKLYPESGVPWLAYASAKPVWIEDIRQKPEADPTGILEEARLRAAFAIPILGRRKALGVIEWFHTEVREEEPALIETGLLLGKQVGMLLESRKSRSRRAA